MTSAPSTMTPSFVCSTTRCDSAYEIEPEDRVLDIGCGAGQTTRDAARLAGDGSALGVDISQEMIERARRLADAEGLHNVTFEHADAQDHRFPSERFDLAISRFGTMFFRDPVAAFTNIGTGLRRDGRLLIMVWQGHERNEWSMAIQRALSGTGGSPAPTPEGLDHFSLADPATVRRVLDAAGFTDVTLTDVRRPMYFGQDVADAFGWIGGFASTKEVLDRSRSRRAVRSRSNACARRSSRTLGRTASGSTRAPGS